jgi:hypothetical protein
LDPSGPRNWDHNQGRLDVQWKQRKWKLGVMIGRAEVAVRQFRQHPRLDLALIEMEREIPGIAAPLGQPAGEINGDVALAPTLNYGRNGRFSQRMLRFPQISIMYNVVESLPQEIKFDGGTPEGSSGSGLFVDREGAPAFAGLLARGGLDAAKGLLVAGDAVRTFLLECGVAIAPRPLDPVRAASLWDHGVDHGPIELTAPDGSPVHFICLPRTSVDGLPAPVWIAAQPVDNALYAALTGESAPQNPKQPVRLKTQAEAIRAAELFGEHLPAHFGRLPMVAELIAAWQASAPVERAHRTGLDIVIPGPGECEWADDHSGASATRERRGGVLTTIKTMHHPDSRLSGMRFRLVVALDTP